MPCYHPVQAYQPISGGKLLFSLPRGIATKPIKTRCNNCIGCRIDRSLEWALRITHESRYHEDSSFITLTYDDENLPINGSLNKSELQQFFKNLRNYADRKQNKKLRYYAAGEYGDQLGRPHYHACVFGLDFPDKECISDNQGVYLYQSDILEQIWGKGLCSTGEVTYQSAAYVARYIMKKICGDKAEEHYETTCPYTGEIKQLLPEFNTMSNRPGIGRDFYSEFKNDCFPYDFLIHKGRKVPVPKYYTKIFAETDPEVHDQIKEARLANAYLHRKDNTPERLITREYCKMRAIENLKRDL